MKLTLKTCVLISLAFLFFGCSSRLKTNDDLETDGMDEAMRLEFLMTHDPATNTIPRERLAAARQIANALSNTRVTALSWQERGPNNIGGRTRAILVDRADNTGNTVLAASVSGGIFRTTNFLGASTWTPVAENMTNLAVTCLWQNRTNPDIIYAGTGEGWFNVDAVKGIGIFKSTDRGNTWTQLNSTRNFEYVQDLIQDNNNNLYAAVRNISATGARGVQRSSDGGATWTQVLGAPIVGFATGRAADLEVASNGDLYATLGIFTRTMVMKSPGTNGANTGALGTWTEITPTHTAITTRAEIAIAPSNPQKVYLAMVDSTTNKVISFYRSNNAGAVWDSLGAPDAIVNNGPNSQNWYNLILQVSPTNPDFVVLGGLHVGRSTDAGSSWANISSPSGVHVDQHQLIFINASSNLIVCNDGGVYYSSNADATTPTFANKNNSYNVTQFYAADYHPTNTNYFLAGAQDNNTQKFSSPGVNSTTPVVGGDGGFCHIRQTDGVLQIAATTNNNYYRSTNSGATWSSLGSVNNNRGQFINPTDLDDAQNTLYCGDAAGKYYVITGLDATPAGTQVTLNDLGENRIVTAVKVDPITTNTVWFGTSSTGVAVLPMVVKVTNANTAAPTTTAFTLPSVAGASVSSIDVDPNNGNHLLVTLSNYGTTNIFESTNGGTSWTDIDGNLPDMPVRWGLIVPGGASVNGTNQGGLLIATELGVWYATAGSGTATSWAPQNTNFPNVRTDMLKYRPSDRTVVAATHGRGLFTAQLIATTTGINPVTQTKDFIKYSSPLNDQLLIVTGNLNVQKMHLEILDMNGRLVYRSSNRYQNTSIYTDNLSKGLYILRVFGDKNEYYAQQFFK